MSGTDEINIGQIDERFMRYIEINEEKKRIELYKCPVPGCDFKTQLGPGAVRMHTIIIQSKFAIKDGSGESRWKQTGGYSGNPEERNIQAHIDYFKENNILSVEDVKELGRTDTRPYAERDI